MAHHPAFLWLLIFLVLSTQVSSAYITKLVLRNYSKPLLLTLLNTCALSLLLLTPRRRSEDSISLVPPRKTVTLFLLTLWLSANIPYTVALRFTTVATALSIEQSATLLAYVFTFFILPPPTPSLFLLLPVLLSGTGIIFIVLWAPPSSAEASNPLLGNSLVVCSAIAVGLYVTCFKRVMLRSGSSDPTKSIAYIGMACLLVSPAFIITSHYTNLEIFSIPDSSIIGFLVARALLSIIFNLSLNWGLAIAAPSFIRIASACSIPVSMTIDYFMGAPIAPLQAVGMGITFAAFLLYVLMDRPITRDLKQDHDDTDLVHLLSEE